MNTGRNHQHLLHGLVAAAFTPMRQDGSIHLTAISEVVESVLGQGADGLFLCGTTGEASSLTIDERRSVVEEYVAAVDHRVPVVVHVGHNSLADARLLASHAASVGAEGISLTPPTYIRPSTIEGVVDCLEEAASAAPDLPLYYYHIPVLTGAHFPMIELLQLASTRLPSMAGIKYSGRYLDDMLACLRFDGERYNILFGADEMLLAGMAMGADGAVGSTYNFLAPIYKPVLTAIAEGRLRDAQDHQAKATQIVHAILEHGGLNAIKAAMGLLGVQCGPTRLPSQPLSSEQIEALRVSLIAAGVKEAELAGRQA